MTNITNNNVQEWRDALSYWEYQSSLTTPNTNNNMGNSFLSDGRNNYSRRRGSLSNMGGGDAFETTTTTTTLSRHGSFSKLPSTTNNAQISDNLAKHLIQSVRGPNAKFSREALQQQQQQHSTHDSHQWQQALQSLFQKFCKELYTFRQQNNNNNNKVNRVV